MLLYCPRGPWMQWVSCGEAENMAAPIFNLHKRRTEWCGSFLWKECVKGTEIHVYIYIYIYAQHGDNAFLWWSVYEWIDMFKKGRTSVTASECLVHLSTVTSARHVAKWTEEDYWKVFLSCTTVPDPIVLSLLGKPFGTWWSSQPSSIQSRPCTLGISISLYL
jgi:hypothetical protein